MEKVLIAGPYADEMKTIMLERLSGFEVAFAKEQEAILNHLDADYVILRTNSMRRDVLEKMPNLKFMQRWGAGVDIIDIEYAGSRGIPVANTAGSNASSVAELAVCLMLSLYRNIEAINNSVKRGEWIKNSIEQFNNAIDDKLVGIIGLGNIGRKVARILTAMDARVQYYDRKDYSSDERAKDYKPVSLDELLETSDIITLHMPLDETSKNMINASAIAKMKKTAVLINTARGGVVDETALYAALKEGRLRGAGLDCFQKEPVAADNPLLTLDNVVLSCHVGGNTADVQRKNATLCPDNIIAFTKGALERRFIKNSQYLKQD